MASLRTSLSRALACFASSARARLWSSRVIALQRSSGTFAPAACRAMRQLVLQGLPTTATRPPVAAWSRIAEPSSTKIGPFLRMRSPRSIPGPRGTEPTRSAQSTSLNASARSALAETRESNGYAPSSSAMSVPFALSMTCGMSARRRSTSVSGPNISPAAMRGSKAYATWPVAPVTTTRTVLATSGGPLLRVRATVDGLGLDLDEDLRVDEVDLHDARRRADVAEHLAVHDRDAVDVAHVAHVETRHDHVAQRSAEVLQRGLHDVDRTPGLLDGVVRDDLSVLIQPGGAGDADDVPVPHGARVAELELELRRGRKEEAALAVGVFGRHQCTPTRAVMRRMTASANSLVPTAVGSSRSALRSYVTSFPSATTDAIARSRRSPASRSPMCRSMSTPASMSAMGFTLFCPAYLGAEPWIASNTATPPSPMFAPGATPSPPTRPATRSETISPYRFGSTRTSYSSGFCTSCMHMLSTMRSSNSMSGYSCATSRAIFKKSPSANFMMLALCTAVTLRRLFARA